MSLNLSADETICGTKCREIIPLWISVPLPLPPPTTTHTYTKYTCRCATCSSPWSEADSASRVSTSLNMCELSGSSRARHTCRGEPGGKGEISRQLYPQPFQWRYSSRSFLNACAYSLHGKKFSHSVGSENGRVSGRQLQHLMKNSWDKSWTCT